MLHLFIAGSFWVIPIKTQQPSQACCSAQGLGHLVSDWNDELTLWQQSLHSGILCEPLAHFSRVGAYLQGRQNPTLCNGYGHTSQTMASFLQMRTSTNASLQPESHVWIMPLSYLGPEIMLKTCSEWRPFWNPRWRPKNANSSLANYLPQFWKPQGTLWYRLPASTQNV